MWMAYRDKCKEARRAVVRKQVRFFRRTTSVIPFIGWYTKKDNPDMWLQSKKTTMKTLPFYRSPAGKEVGWTVREITLDEYNHWMMKYLT
jgi:hypothetical protein